MRAILRARRCAAVGRRRPRTSRAKGAHVARRDPSRATVAPRGYGAHVSTPPTSPDLLRPRPPGTSAAGASDDGAPTARRRYAVVGLGAVGGYYGGRLLAAGHEVHFVA